MTSDPLEESLRSSPIRESIDAGYRGGTKSAASIDAVVLEDGAKAFLKRSDTHPEGTAGPRREVAAYELAKLMGCALLVPVAALRSEIRDDGTVVEVAAMELFLDRQENPGIEVFTEEELDKAGVFDAVVANPDRGNHNWLGVPDENGVIRLKLIDHEGAFGDPGSVGSIFRDRIGSTVPVDMRDAVSALEDDVDNSNLEELLGIKEFEALKQRIRDLRKTY